MDVESKARAQAEVALKEKGWFPREWDPYGQAVDGVAPTAGTYSIRAYPADGPAAPREALCRVDDWTREQGDIIPYLWVVGVPRPEEVPALFEGYPEATGCNDIGDIGDRILDLATGEVIAEKEAQRLVEEPIRDMIRAAQDGIAKLEGVLREIVAAGWDPSHLSLSVSIWERMAGRVAEVRTVTTAGCGSDPHKFLRLRVTLAGDTIDQVHAECPGNGIEVPIADWTTDPDIAIPTPDEAWEAYGAALSRGTIVGRQMLIYEPRSDL